MRVLFVSNLYPDASQPQYGLHNARVVRDIGEECELRVVAPRPSLAFWRRASVVGCPEDTAFRPAYPRVPYVPKVGSAVNHLLFGYGLRRAFDAAVEVFSPDVVLAAWLYPDACAAVRLARRHGLSAVQVAQGTDVHRYLRNPHRRRAILRAATDAHCTIARSRYLAEQLVEAGAPEDSVRVIYSGVDRDVFRPARRGEVRKKLGIPADAAVVLFVGHLFPVKNPVLAIRAVARATGMERAERDWRLVFVGEGELREQVVAESRGAGLSRSVQLVGEKRPAEVAAYMQAADVLCVPSNDEGLPNVIREAFACGLPVTATRVGGIPEIVTDSFLGELVPARNEEAMARALCRIINRQNDADAIRKYSARFSREETRRQYLEALAEAIPPCLDTPDGDTQ